MKGCLVVQAHVLQSPLYVLEADSSLNQCSRIPTQSGRAIISVHSVRMRTLRTAKSRAASPTAASLSAPSRKAASATGDVAHTQTTIFREQKQNLTAVTTLGAVRAVLSVATISRTLPSTEPSTIAILSWASVSTVHTIGPRASLRFDDRAIDTCGSDCDGTPYVTFLTWGPSGGSAGINLPTRNAGCKDCYRSPGEAT